jgi:Flp pilus assembly pilin Flp
MKKKIQASELRTENRQTRRGLARDERGLSTVEYIIILMLIAVAGIALWSAFGETVSGKIGEATGEVGSL